METLNVTFDEILAMDFKQNSSKPGLQSMTSRQISSVLDLTYALSTITTQKPTERELDFLFEAMYNDYIGGQLSTATRTAPAPQVLQTPTTSTTSADTAPTPTYSSSQAATIPNTSHDVDKLPQQQHVQQQDNPTPLQSETVIDNVSNAMLDVRTGGQRADSISCVYHIVSQEYNNMIASLDRTVVSLGRVRGVEYKGVEGDI
ncbi:hypothetical protein Tco_0333343 [Tanacetum coccineum]